MKETDGLKKEGDISGLRKEIDGLKKVPVGSLDAMVGMVGLHMRCDAVVDGLRKEIDGLKKVSVGSLDVMVGMVGTIVKGKGRGSGGIVKNIVKGKRWFIAFFGFITFFLLV